MRLSSHIALWSEPRKQLIMLSLGLGYQCLRKQVRWKVLLSRIIKLNGLYWRGCSKNWKNLWKRGNLGTFRWQRRLVGRHYTFGVVLFAEHSSLKNFPTLVRKPLGTATVNTPKFIWLAPQLSHYLLQSSNINASIYITSVPHQFSFPIFYSLKSFKYACSRVPIKRKQWQEYFGRRNPLQV